MWQEFNFVVTGVDGRRRGGYRTRMMTTRMQQAAAVVAGAFTLVGILGFIPGITTNYDQLELAGHESGAELLGLFQVSILHNIVHLGFGLAGFALARTWSGARAFLIGGGILYFVVFLYGLIIDKQTDANFLPVNSADDWLHLVLSAGMVLLGGLFTRERPAETGLRAG